MGRRGWSRLEAPYPGVVFFFLFGYGVKQKQLGAGEVRTCPRCHNTTQWARMQEYKEFSLFFIPVARWNRREFDVCTICGAMIGG